MTVAHFDEVARPPSDAVVTGDALLIPRRPTGTKRVTCAPATYTAVHDFLTNPVYPVTFVLGGTHTDKGPDAAGRDRQRRNRATAVRIVLLGFATPQCDPVDGAWMTSNGRNNVACSNGALLKVGRRERAQGLRPRSGGVDPSSPTTKMTRPAQSTSCFTPACSDPSPSSSSPEAPPGDWASPRSSPSAHTTGDTPGTQAEHQRLRHHRHGNPSRRDGPPRLAVTPGDLGRGDPGVFPCYSDTPGGVPLAGGCEAGWFHPGGRWSTKSTMA